MKTIRRMAVLLAALLLLTACGKTKDEPSGSAPAGTSDNPSETVTSPLPSESDAVQDTQPTVLDVADGRLMVLQSGAYNGLCPENGSDERVENAAALLVANVSEQACQFCTLNYQIDGEDAVFQISELPAGKAVWVLESGGKTTSADAVFTYVSDISVFREQDSQWLPDVTAEGGDGKLTVSNQSDRDYALITVYYKLTYGENTYLGGIAYRVTVDGLKSGESKTLTAGHFYEGSCEIVGIYADGATD